MNKNKLIAIGISALVTVALIAIYTYNKNEEAKREFVLKLMNKIEAESKAFDEDFDAQRKAFSKDFKKNEDKFDRELDDFNKKF